MIKIYNSSEISIDEILERSEQTIDVEGIVSDIIKNVRANGDKALVEYSKKFDGAVDDILEVTPEEIEEAFNQVDDELVEILKQAKENITAFHSRQVRNSFVLNDKDGVIMGQKVIPIEKVGLYVPGGTAAYPSTVTGSPGTVALVYSGTIVYPVPTCSPFSSYRGASIFL